MKPTRLRHYLPALLLILFAVIAVQHGWAQDAAPVAPPKAENRSVLQVISHGGPLIILIWLAILGTSMTMVSFVIQNFLTLREEKLAPSPLVAQLHQTLVAGNYQEAWQICHGNRNYLANVLGAGLERLGRGRERVEEALAEHGMREASRLRTRNSYLSVIGVVSPMIGLLGTVIGMMGAFEKLGQSGISDPSGLAASIGEVLLATASGLFIAIPAFIFYYIFRNRAQAVIVHAEDRLNYLVEDIPYEELGGIRIGEDFDAGSGTGDVLSGLSQRVSRTLTTSCPICSAPISAGVSPCPSCGSRLDWT